MYLRQDSDVAIDMTDPCGKLVLFGFELPCPLSSELTYYLVQPFSDDTWY